MKRVEAAVDESTAAGEREKPEYLAISTREGPALVRSSAASTPKPATIDGVEHLR